MVCTDLPATGQKFSNTLKSKNLAILAFIKIKTHLPKLAEVKPSFRKVSLTPAKLYILYPFPTHLWVREFWPQIYSLSKAGLGPKF